MPNIKINRGSPFPLGSSLLGNSANFSIFSLSPELSLCLFEKNKTHPFQTILLDPLHHKTGNIWHVQVENMRPGIVYAYKTTKSDYLLDPYAKAINTSNKWRNPKYVTHYHPLGVLTGENFDWEGIESPKIPADELIIYEMHMRGFTKDRSSRTKNPGTFSGFIEKIPYLKALGINAIDLLPIFEFNEAAYNQTNPITKQVLCNYWGYMTVNYFSVMNRYSASEDPLESIKEFKTLVKECHRHGIEVILDVVYNHTAEGNEKGPGFSFRGLAPLYYILDKDGNYLDFTGCGNTLNSNHPIVLEFIIHSLHYWVSEFHIDGFRFDLASTFYRDVDGSVLKKPPILEAITEDPVLAYTKLIAEPWDVSSLYQVGGFSPSHRWAEWNGKFRDSVRRFIKGDSWQKGEFATRLCGSQDLYGIRSPLSSINFITAHDGFTLHDLVSYNEKHNEENGEKNRDGFQYNDSWNCGIEGETKNKKIIKLRQQQMRNFVIALFVAQGIPMFYMGDEYGHTKKGNNNTWCQDNEMTWFLWDQIEKSRGFFRFCQLMIQFRKTHSILRKGHFLTEKEIIWHGIEPNQPAWDQDNRFIAFSLIDKEQKMELYIAFNSSHIPIEAKYPLLGRMHWGRVVDTHNESPEDFMEKPELITKGTYTLFPYSAIILKKIK